MQTPFTLPIRIYVEDTDFGGIVYHSKFLNYMERARTEWLISLGMDLHQLAQEDCLFAVRTANLEFLKPARVNQMIEITSKVIEHSPVTLTFEQIARNMEDKSCIYCQGTIRLVCISAGLKLRKLPKEIVEKIK